MDAATALPSSVDVAVVGAGFGGIGMAIRLRQAGIEDFVVLERAPDLGGTWYANTYPGCQCDVPANLYSFSFARNPDWRRSYPEQPQILEYLRRCARELGVEPHLHRETEMLDAAWDGDAQRWRVETSRGTLDARVLVAAPGLLSEPVIPALPGLDGFAGKVFHSAAWDHEHDLSGERVALIGTGATAVQIAPKIRPRVGRLLVFQRTPPWVLPHVDRPVGRVLRSIYRRFPPLQRAARAGVYGLREQLVVSLVYAPRAGRLNELVARGHMRRQVRDPELRRRLTPGYAIGCKRILLSNKWYPTLTAPNTEVVSAGIASVSERAIVDTEGVAHPVDTIVFATGFSPSDPPIARRVRGRDGQTLSDVWAGSPQAYKSTAVAGFPNLFLLYGPNLNLGHTSIVYMLESQIAYVLDALALMRSRDAVAMEVRADVQAAWNAELQRRLAGTVWDTGGCGSWYLDANGRNSIQWPGFTFEFRRRTAAVEPAEYALA
ncbi:MAG TPA: NAD(P)/FAD-dependent oxidoreductase [Solirubrobacteraceae bacterium]|jgi:cation diffusion facilitator CzcD-associated flavoprotein CzcO